MRELRDSLRRWLDAVKKGHEVTITERGRPVARLIPADLPPAIEQLIAQGIVTRASRPAKSASGHRRVKTRGGVSELVKDQRR